MNKVFEELKSLPIEKLDKLKEIIERMEQEKHEHIRKNVSDYK